MNSELLIGAKPDCNLNLVTINPYDKHSRGKGLNYKEYSEFNGICRISNEQIIYCYSHYDKDMLPQEFVLRCQNCPYARNLQLGNQTNLSIVFPYFIVHRDEYDPDTPKAYVYFVSDGEYVKIGVATDIDKRLAALQTANARTLQLICKIPTKSENAAYSLENFLHSQYDAFRLSGEWFNILNFISVEKWKTFFDEGGVNIE